MKKVFSAVSFALFLGAQVLAAQAQTEKNSASNPPAENAASATPARDKKTQQDKSAPPKSAPDEKAVGADELTATPATAAASPLTEAGSNAATTDAPGKKMTTVPGAVAAPLPQPESIYRVGAGDVLDIRLLNQQTRESTLFTVLADGLLEYPLAGDAVQVGGLTTDEIDARLTAKIQIYENPQVSVSVREYVSHHAIVTGLVIEPGAKVLRREAVPLYVLLAEAQPRPEAGRATIQRPGGQSVTIDLADTKAASTLVFHGDVITLKSQPPALPQFFYIGGPVIAPGQKDFHAGMTLTQAVLASGGVTRFAGSKVKISRQGENGLLSSTEYNLKQIEAGKIPDPVLQPGDRLEVSRGGW